MRYILATSALPYANGSIHLGHLVEYIQTDIWVRFQKMAGHRCHYVCADDTHGTPIMLSAKKQGITPEALIEKMSIEHQADFRAFSIAFDGYYSTNSNENRLLAEHVFLKAKDKGFIEERTIEQSYCPSCQLFLPDRFIRGTCPSCKTPDQYGDSCESCAATYQPTDLIDSACVECGTSPVLKSSNHFFFKLSALTDFLQHWVHEDHIRPEIQRKLDEWFVAGLQDWDISRDAPYFGFQIPGTTDKFFYVWMDAPIGYLSATQKLCEEQGLVFDDFWKPNGPYEIHHFIGKDILYFHTLFWPAMLSVSDFKTPSKIHIHGFLTVNGEKMSKSRGTFINARTYLNHLPPAYLRYYYASKLSGTTEDLDLNLQDFVYKVNADVVNKVINIASRLGTILTKKLDGKLSTPDPEGHALLTQMDTMIPAIYQAYDRLDFQSAMKEIMKIADMANKFINDKAPWEFIATNPDHATALCTTGLNAFKRLMGLLKPVVPTLTEKAEYFLNCPPITWDTLSTPLCNHPIRPFEKMADRLDLSMVEPLLTS